MWDTENRSRYDRSKLRYPSDLTDDEWAIIEPLIPPGKRGGNKRTVNVREIVNGLMYILSTSCQWAALPKDLPPRSTVNLGSIIEVSMVRDNAMVAGGQERGQHRALAASGSVR